MQVGNASAVKREQDSDDEALGLPATLSKRAKLEANTVDDEGLSLQKKPATQGVEQIPYPPECRPTGLYYTWHRRQLIAAVKERLAVQYRLVTAVRFLDDAVAFDWLFDKSTMHALHGKSSDDGDPKCTISESEGIQSRHTKLDSISKVQDEEIPGLHLYNSSVVNNVSEGSIANPILVPDTDGFIAGVEETENTHLNSCAHNRGQLQQSIMATAAAESNMSTSDTESSSCMVEILLATGIRPGIGEGMCTSEPEQPASQRMEYTALAPPDSTQLIEPGITISHFNPPDSASPVEVVMHVSQRRRASSSSSSCRRGEIRLPPAKSFVGSSSASQSFHQRRTSLPAGPAPEGTALMNTTGREDSAPNECSIQFRSFPETEGLGKVNSDGISLPLGRRVPHALQQQVAASHTVSFQAPQLLDVQDVIEVRSGSDTDDKTDVSSSSSGSSFESDSSVSSGRNANQHTVISANLPARGVKVGSAYRIKQIQLPHVKHGRARRLLLPPSQANSLISVTMRGDVQFIDQTTQERLVKLSLPAEASRIRRLEDACLSNGTAVLGFSMGDGSQASVVAFVDKAKSRAEIFSLEKTPHTRAGILSLAPFNSFPNRRSNSDPADTIGNTFEFLSGGYDKTVQYWRVTSILGDSGRPRFVPRVAPLCGGPLNTKISALMRLPGRSLVLAAAGQRLWTLDVESQAPASFVPFSNSVKQLHVPCKKDPNIFIVEVDHLFSQMQVFDLRKDPTGSGRPVLEFGYAESAPDTRGVRSQKRRGDTSVKHFARGYQDGTVCIWDYRNVKEHVVADKSASPITHTIFAGKTRNLWTFAGDKVRFLEMD